MEELKASNILKAGGLDAISEQLEDTESIDMMSV